MKLARKSDIPIRYEYTGFLGISGGESVLIWGKTAAGASFLSALTVQGDLRWTIEIWDAVNISVAEGLRDQVVYVFQRDSREHNGIWSVALDTGKIEKHALPKDAAFAEVRAVSSVGEALYAKWDAAGTESWQMLQLFNNYFRPAEPAPRGAKFLWLKDYKQQSDPVYRSDKNEIIAGNTQFAIWPEARALTEWIYAWPDAIIGRSALLPGYLAYATGHQVLLRAKQESAWGGEPPCCHFPTLDPMSDKAAAALFVTAKYQFGVVNGFPGEPAVPQFTLRIFDAVNGAQVLRLDIDDDIYEPRSVQVDCMRSTMYLSEKKRDPRRIVRWAVSET